MKFLPKILIPVLACLTPVAPVAGGPHAIPAEFSELFPIGRTFSGVKIPSYTNDVLKTVLEAEAITRVNDTYLDLSNLVLKVYNPEGGIESTVEMKEARYHLITGQLLSQTPAKVNHEKFVMTGEQLGYDTTTELSTMKGNVKVVIPKAREFTGNFGLDALDSK
ncbi:MAG: LPS export ABC transporter periplasmic protein LptC [Verrucomicrobiales bacterium]|nr:LPS export ABC transporter periplasmic protein LptC [Verrucomicrobiales bacterium]